MVTLRLMKVYVPLRYTIDLIDSTWINHSECILCFLLKTLHINKGIFN